jgi:hypothetical protein
MKKLFTSLLALTALAVLPLWAEDKKPNGDDFFNDATVEVAPDDKAAPKPDEALDKESVSLTGNIDALGSYTLTRDFLWGYKDLDNNALSYILTGDFLLDARLRKGFRAFADLTIGYSNVGMSAYHYYNLMSPITSTVYDITMTPIGTNVIMPGTLMFVSEEQNLAIGIKELFLDLNIANAVYFRVGKQVLQWGRGYLFLNLAALRQGNFGLRADFVFDRAFRVYSYVQFEGATDFSQMAVAGKAEVLIGSAEMSLSAWWKGGKIPVFGYDISVPLFWSIDFHGEAAFSWGDNLDKMHTDGSVYQIRDVPVVRASAGLSRSFAVDNDDNRVMLNTEFYFNSSGYEENMFEALSPSNLAIFMRGYFDNGNYGKYYGMLALTINKFLVNQLTFTLSGIGNFSDMSFIAVGSFSYAPVYNFTIDLKILSYIGLNNREYTVAPAMDGTSVTLGNNMFGANLSCSVKF